MRIRAAAVVTACAAGAAAADIVEMRYSALGQGRNAALTAGDRSLTVFAGQLVHEVTGGTGTGADLERWLALYCADVHQYVASSPSEFLITGLTEVPDSSPMGADAAAAIEGMLAHTGLTPFEADVSDSFASAFQLAIWEIASDFDAALGRSSLNLAAGWFRATPSGSSSVRSEVLGHVDLLFDAAAAGDPFGGQVMAFRSDRYQDQMFATIPTQSSMVAMLAGLVVTAGRRRS